LFYRKKIQIDKLSLPYQPSRTTINDADCIIINEPKKVLKFKHYILRYTFHRVDKGLIYFKIRILDYNITIEI
jgi:hypothetical protein